MEGNIISIKTEKEKVKEILDAEQIYQDYVDELNCLQLEAFGEAVPQEPKLKTVSRTYPEVNPKVKINALKTFAPAIISFLAIGLGSDNVLGIWLSLLLCLGGIAGLIASLIYVVKVYIFDKHKLEKEETQKIINSPEYQAKCAEMNLEYDAQDLQLKQEYDDQMRLYNAAIEKYQDNEKKWQEKHDLDVSELGEKIETAKAKRDGMYETYKIIPTKYRKLKALKYIYDYMDSSSSDLQTAIESYDRELLRKKEEARLREEQERLREIQRQNELAEREYYEENSSESSHGFISDVTSTAIGTAIGTHGVKKEIRKQREDEERRHKEDVRRQQQKEHDERHRRAVESQREWNRVKKINDERFRKGLPELPYPERFYD